MRTRHCLRAALLVALVGAGCLSSCSTAIPGTAQAVGPAASSQRGGGLTGTWRGHVVGDFHEYDIVVSLRDDAGALSGEVVYTNGTDCQGTWTQQSRSGADIRLLERVVGRSCVPQAQIELTDQPPLLGFRASSNTGKFPTSTLQRDNSS